MIATQRGTWEKNRIIAGSLVQNHTHRAQTFGTNRRNESVQRREDDDRVGFAANTRHVVT